MHLAGLAGSEGRMLQTPGAIRPCGDIATWRASNCLGFLVDNRMPGLNLARKKADRLLWSVKISALVSIPKPFLTLNTPYQVRVAD